MKGPIITLAILIISSLSVLTAQTSYTYYDNGSNDRYQYRYNDRGNYQDNYRDDYRRDRNRSSYRRDNNVYSRMSQRDRKSLNKLERKLRETERCAWENGRLSRNEIRKLDNIRDDIDRLIRKYDRRDRYNDRPNNGGRRSCP
jgi:hypothetical protein